MPSQAALKQWKNKLWDLGSSLDQAERWLTYKDPLENKADDLERYIAMELNIPIGKMSDTETLFKGAGFVTDLLGGPKIKVRKVKVSGNVAGKLAGVAFDVGEKLAGNEKQRLMAKRTRLRKKMRRMRKQANENESWLRQRIARRRNQIAEARKKVEELELNAKLEKEKKARQEMLAELELQRELADLRARGLIPVTNNPFLGKRDGVKKAIKILYEWAVIEGPWEGPYQ